MTLSQECGPAKAGVEPLPKPHPTPYNTGCYHHRSLPAWNLVRRGLRACFCHRQQFIELRVWPEELDLKLLMKTCAGPVDVWSMVHESCLVLQVPTVQEFLCFTYSPGLSAPCPWRVTPVSPEERERKTEIVSRISLQ